MLRNYLKLIFRNLFRNKTFTIINVIGLAVGLAACLLIFLYVEDEVSYDKYHEKSDRIYRLGARVDGASYENGIAKVADLWGPGSKASLPDIEEQTRFVFFGQTLVERGDRRQYEPNGMYADSATFAVFTWRLIQGDPQTALVGPHKLVVTESFADRWFGDENPMGQSLLFDNATQMTVSGVMEDVPVNSHFTFDFLVSLESYQNPRRGDWVSWNQFYTYLLLGPGANSAAVADGIEGLLDKNLQPELAAAYHPLLQPLSSIHLHSDLHREMSSNSDIRYVYIFSTIALFILLIACTNFVSLSTARASRRAQEVGVRKVSGADRASLIRRFLGESIVLSAIAVLTAWLLSYLFLQGFNVLSGKSFAAADLSGLSMTFGLVFVAVGVGIAAGIYPAFVLSSFKPAAVLKGGEAYQGSSVLRKGLVVLQFTISACLLIATGVVYNQLSYIHHKNLGFDKEQMLVVPTNDRATAARYEVVKSQLLDVSGVASASFSANRPGGSDWGIPVEFEGVPDNEAPAVRMLCVDHDFIETFGIQVVQGRAFSRDFPNDTLAYVLNETAAEALGWQIGRSGRIRMPVINRDYGEMIGIVKDFHFRSMHERIGPLVMFIQPSFLNTFNVRIQTTDMKGTLAGIERVMTTQEPRYPFTYRFFDEQFDSLHASEKSTGSLLAYFAGLAIFIAGLGLIGLASFTAERRTKEIGIRKVMGASVARILVMLSTDVAALVALGVMLATPIGYFTMKAWLSDFAYSAGLGWQVFALSAIGVMAVAIVATCLQSIGAALTDPVRSLRHE